MQIGIRGNESTFAKMLFFWDFFSNSSLWWFIDNSFACNELYQIHTKIKYFKRETY